MIKTIRNFFQTKAVAAENRLAQERTYSLILQEAQGLVMERPDAGGFVRVSQASDREKGHFEPNQLEMIRQARKMYRWNENARAAITTLVNYVMGRGVIITPKAQDQRVWYIWREFWTAHRNDMRLKEFEIPTRLFRDGEVFIEFFDADDNGKATGKTTIRFIDPLLIRNPAPEIGTRYDFDKVNTRNGIETDAEDVERVLRYWVQSRTDANAFRSVPAENVLHIKIFADSDQKRGETLLQPVMRMITHHEQWLENRLLLNKMRTAIVLIKKIEGTPSQVAALKDTIGNAGNQPPGWSKKQNIRGGTVLVAGPGVDYKMESPNINATDAKEDGRHLKTSMAAGTNLAEYVFGDASNANYSSSMVAEAPMVKAIQYWQVFLEFYWSELFRIVVRNAVKAGFVPEPNDADFMRALKNESSLTEQEGDSEPLEKYMAAGKLETPTEVFYGCDLQWPEIIHREMKAHTESLRVARQSGWVSDVTAASALGYDYSEEVRKQKTAEVEAAENGNPLMGIRAGGEHEDGEMESELKSVIDALSPMERQAILQQRDPAEVARMMLATAGGNGNANDPAR